MNWLILLYFIELGYSPFYDSRNTTEIHNKRTMTETICYVNINTELVILDYLFIGGAVKTYIHPTKDDLSFQPFEVDYIFRTGLRYKNFELGFKHFCLHPVRPYEMYYNAQGSTDGAYEEFYIRVSNEF